MRSVQRMRHSVIVPLAVVLQLTTLSVAPRAFAQGASLTRATNAQTAQAKEKYRAGMAAYGEQKFAEALDLFRQSYEAVRSPNSHLMIARTLARQDRLADAYAELQLVQVEAQQAALLSDKYEETAEAAATELKEITAQLAFIRPTIAGEVAIGERVLKASERAEAVTVAPGTVEVSWTLPDGSRVKETVTARAGETVDVELSPPQAQTSAAPTAVPSPAVTDSPRGINQQHLGFVVGAIGVGGMLTFGVFGAINNSKFNDLEAECPNRVCSPQLASQAETGRRFQAVANAGLGIGIVGIATGAVLVLTAPRAARKLQATTTPTLVVTPRAVALSGRF